MIRYGLYLLCVFVRETVLTSHAWQDIDWLWGRCHPMVSPPAVLGKNPPGLFKWSACVQALYPFLALGPLGDRLVIILLFIFHDLFCCSSFLFLILWLLKLWTPRYRVKYFNSTHLKMSQGNIVTLTKKTEQYWRRVMKHTDSQTSWIFERERKDETGDNCVWGARQGKWFPFPDEYYHHIN